MAASGVGLVGHGGKPNHEGGTAYSNIRAARSAMRHIVHNARMNALFVKQSSAVVPACERCKKIVPLSLLGYVALTLPVPENRSSQGLESIDAQYLVLPTVAHHKRRNLDNPKPTVGVRLCRDEDCCCRELMDLLAIEKDESGSRDILWQSACLEMRNPIWR